MKKKGILFTVLLTLVIISGCFTGCKSSSDSRFITKGDWITYLASSFGMNQYTNNTPYYSDIDKKDEIFPYIQACCEWGILSTDEPKFSEDSYTTYGFAVATSVLAIGDPSLEEKSADNLETLFQYAIDKGIINSTSSIDKVAKHKVTREEAISIAQKAIGLWQNPNYKPVESYDLKDDVIDFTKNKNAFSDYTVDSTNKEVFISDSNIKIDAGDFYVLPADEEHPWAGIYKAESVEYTENGIRIKNSNDDLSFEDAVENLQVQNSFSPDFSNCPITDGTGKLLTWESDLTGSDKIGNNKTGNESGGVIPLNYTNRITKGNTSSGIRNLKQNWDDQANAEYMGATVTDKSVTLDFNVENVKVKGKIDSDSVTFTAEVKINDYVNVSKSYKLSDFNIDGSTDYNIFEGLKYARASYDYTLEEATKVTANYDSKSLNEKLGNVNDLTNYSQYLSDALKNVTDITGSKYTGKSILIASIPTPITVGGMAGVIIEIRLGFSVEGSIELNVTTKTTQGIEYRKGSGIRTISDKSVDQNIKLEAKAEMYLSVGVVLEAFTCNIVDVAAEVGIGGTVSTTLHMLDYSDKSQVAYQLAAVTTGLPGDALYLVSQKVNNQNGLIKIEQCTDVKVYFIFRITAGKNSLIGKLASITYDVCGKDNGPYFVNNHYENGINVGDKCTLKFRTEKGATASPTVTGSVDSGNNTNNSDAEDSNSSENVTTGTQLDLSEYAILVDTGASYQLKLDMIPEGNSESDIIWESSDTSIATVSSSGLVTGVSAGSAIVSAKTSDGTYNITCSVTVNSTDKTN